MAGLATTIATATTITAANSAALQRGVPGRCHSLSPEAAMFVTATLGVLLVVLVLILGWLLWMLFDEWRAGS